MKLLNKLRYKDEKKTLDTNIHNTLNIAESYNRIDEEDKNKNEKMEEILKQDQFVIFSDFTTKDDVSREMLK